MLKRLFDVAAALILLIILSPVFLLLAVTIACTMGWPVLFLQQRAGRHGWPFVLLKFRTMTNTRDPDGRLLPETERLTPVGKFIRSTSLDELPQLINVLKGEMSLVGPRPLPLVYNERYTARQARRLEVFPGITGWTAVKGRSALEWETKFDLDVYYVEHRSFLFDLRILWLTLVKVICREGISYPGEVNSKVFWGTKLPAEHDGGRGSAERSTD